MDDSLTASDFLDIVWDYEGLKASGQSVWVDLPSKSGAHWIPYNCEFPSDRPLIRRRIQSCVEDGEDIYFSCATFRSRGRRIVDVLPTRWLWADLDKVDPVFLDEDKVLPTIAWESSPGRYQCMWRLSVILDPANQTRLARSLTRAIGADRGGYDLTQVLRPPGTRNFKYGDEVSAPNVELLWCIEDIVYRPKDIVKAVRGMGAEVEPRQNLYERAHDAEVEVSRLPARARRLLNTPSSQVVEGERSARLWELERLLVENGLGEDQVYDLVVGTPWNKWKEAMNGEQRLRDDIAKAFAEGRRPARKGDSPRIEGDQLPAGGLGEGEEVRGGSPDSEEIRTRSRASFIDYADFISSSIPSPKWLVEDIWSGASHGFFGGEPKTAKSTIAMALGMSIASGKPFLGYEQFGVRDPGPVLMVQEENAPWVVQDRLRKIAHLYGLIRPSDIEIADAPTGSLATQTIRLDFPDEVPFKMLNNYGFSLFEDEDRETLEEAIQIEGAKAIILDPLYLVAPGLNLNNGADVTPILKYLMDIRYKLDCAVVVVHHMHKASTDSAGRRTGQRLMGSGLFHGWIESALYFEDMGEADGRKNVKIEREFRNVAPRKSLEVSLDLGEPGIVDAMTVKCSEWGEAGQVEALVMENGPMRLAELARKLKTTSASAKRQALAEGFFMKQVTTGRQKGWYVTATLEEGRENGRGK